MGSSCWEIERDAEGMPVRMWLAPHVWTERLGDDDIWPLGALMIREAAYRICSPNPPHAAEKWERRNWAKKKLDWAYRQAGNVVRAFPASRIRP